MRNLLLFAISALLFSCSGEANEKEIELKKRIELKLNDAINTFSSTNNAFLFTIFHSDMAILQVVHRSYIEQTKQADDKFGLALNVTFDSSIPEEIKYHSRFKALSLSNNFTPYDWDGIPCYALDLESDAAKGAEIITKLLSEVYRLGGSNKLDIELLDQGRI